MFEVERGLPDRAGGIRNSLTSPCAPASSGSWRSSGSWAAGCSSSRLASRDINHNQLLSAFCNRPGIEVATWRQRPGGWGGGPVLAAWPSRDKLAEIADHQGVRALCVVPWAEGEVDAWAAATDPELLLGAEQRAVRSVIDPVVVEGLRSLTLMVNHSNNLAGALDKRDAVAVLTTLHRGGHRLEAEAIYGWALANGWPGRGAERLREMAAKIDGGVRMRTGTGDSPLRPDALSHWREQAAQPRSDED